MIVRILASLSGIALLWSVFVIVNDQTGIGEPQPQPRTAESSPAPQVEAVPVQESNEVARSEIHGMQAELLEISEAGQDGAFWSAHLRIANPTAKRLPRSLTVICDLYTTKGTYITSSRGVHTPDPLDPGESIEGETSTELPRGAVVDRFECELN